MQFFKDSTEVTAVRWYFVPPKTPFLPFPTRFASGNWAARKEGWTGPGEIEGVGRPWSNGALPLPWGVRKPCGTPEQFLEGVTIDQAVIFPPTSGCLPKCYPGPPGFGLRIGFGVFMGIGVGAGLRIGFGATAHYFPAVGVGMSLFVQGDG